MLMDLIVGLFSQKMKLDSGLDYRRVLTKPKLLGTLIKTELRLPRSESFSFNFSNRDI